MKIFKRRLKKGTRYGIDYQINGVRKRVLVGTRKEAQTFMEEVIQNKNRIKVGLPVEEHGQSIPRSITDALDAYFEKKVPNLRSTSIVKSHLGINSPFRKKFGTRQIDGVSHADMENFRDSLLKNDLAYESVKRIMTCIQSFFSWCKSQRPSWLEGENPASRLWANCRTTTKNPGWVKHRLTHSEVMKIIELARSENPERADFYLWQYLSMMRPSEAKRLTFDDFEQIERGNWILRISETKRGSKVKVIPVDGELLEIYYRQKQRRNGEDTLWPRQFFNTSGKVFKRHCRQLGITLKFGNNLYVLKHSGVSFLVNELGVPSKIVSDISGVSVQIIEKHYLKSTEDQLRAAMKKASWHVSGTDLTSSLEIPTTQELPA